MEQAEDVAGPDCDCDLALDLGGLGREEQSELLSTGAEALADADCLNCLLPANDLLPLLDTVRD